MKEKVIDLIADQLGVNREEVKLESKISEDLGGDSLDKVELVMKIEEEFGVAVLDEGDPYFSTVEDIINLVEKKKGE